jgi:hypothetical protein
VSYIWCLLAQGDNISFEEAIKDDKWRAAMDDKIHAIWLRRLLKEINLTQNVATPIYLDSKSAIELLSIFRK